MTGVILKHGFHNGNLTFLPPENETARKAVLAELQKCHDKHSDYVLVTLRPPKRPRTTGECSQNHHLNGHVMQICEATGNTYDAVKHCVKMVAVESMGYPFRTLAGHIVPQGERECDTQDCAKLIKAAHVLAAELGIILQE